MVKGRPYWIEENSISRSEDIDKEYFFERRMAGRWTAWRAEFDGRGAARRRLAAIRSFVISEHVSRGRKNRAGRHRGGKETQ